MRVKQEKKPNVKKGGGVKGRSNKTNSTTSALPSNSFVGETDELHGHIYDVNTSKQSELFTTTTKKIANYAGRTCREAKDISLAIEELKDPLFPRPVKQNTGDSDVDNILLKEEVQLHVRRKSTYRQNQATMFAIVLGQCTDAMKAKLEAESRYENTAQSRDVIELLKIMRDSAFNYESDRYPFLAVHLALKQYYEHFQKYTVPADTYLESFTNLTEVVEHCGGSMGEHEALKRYIFKIKKFPPQQPTPERSRQ